MNAPNVGSLPLPHLFAPPGKLGFVPWAQRFCAVVAFNGWLVCADATGAATANAPIVMSVARMYLRIPVSDLRVLCLKIPDPQATPGRLACERVVFNTWRSLFFLG